MCAVRRTCRPAAAGRRRRNSKRSWIIAASFLPIRSVRWRTCNWAEHFVISGDVAKAKNAYQDFLTLWNDADADIPVLQQARAEFAKL